MRTNTTTTTCSSTFLGIPSSKVLPLTALGLAQVINSAWHILGSRVLSDVPYVSPLDFTVMRQVLTCALLTIWARSVESDGKDKRPIRLPPFASSDFNKLVVGGVCGGFLVPIFYLQGLGMTTPTTTSIWDGPMLPVLVFCTTLALGIEKLTNPAGRIGSLLLTSGGSLLVLLGDYDTRQSEIADTRSSKGSDSLDKLTFLLGNIIMIVQVACFATMTMMQRQLKKYPPLTLTSWLFCIGAIANILVVLIMPGTSIWAVAMKSIHALRESKTFVFGLAYAVVGMSAITYTILSYGSRHLESSVVTLFAAAQPPITVAMEAVLFTTPVGIKKQVGMVLVVVGMYYFTMKSTTCSVEVQLGNVNEKKQARILPPVLQEKRSMIV